MLVDDITIRVHAGKGGDGRVAFQKVKMALGPTGASGGHGGDVFFEGVSDIGALAQFRNHKDFKAEPGEVGNAQFRDGARGEPLVLKIPVGTVVHNLDTGVSREILKIGERLLIAKGGRGGRGNFFFRSSTNTSPKERELGTPGESYEVRLELRLIADVGLVGLPNVGKSSLLNVLTRANAKVANYAFTTLEPNLGAYFDLVIADIPGLIEGASEGKGLGVKFLRHVARTKVLFHLISAESEDPKKDYDTVRAELAAFDPTLSTKEEHIFVSKSDLVPVQRVNEICELLNALPISVDNESSLKRVKEILNDIAKEKLAK